MQSLDLLQEFVSLPGPPGQEALVRAALGRHLDRLGVRHQTDAKGNLIARIGSEENPKIVVTAHMDEIAMIVRGINEDGTIEVGPLGGLFPWKIGEGPVVLLCGPRPIDGVLSFGSIHTDDPGSTVRRVEQAGLSWRDACVITGLSESELASAGARAGSRVAIAPSRRTLVHLGPLVASFFLDDRADLVSWLLALEQVKKAGASALFVATTSEEVGGEGAKYAMRNIRPEICIALELGPSVIDSPIILNDQPTVWVTDSYSSLAAEDCDMLARLGSGLGMELQFQALSRGGSDASASAAEGLCARPFTLGLPMENSHGFEIMNPGAMEELARLTAALVGELS